MAISNAVMLVQSMLLLMWSDVSLESLWSLKFRDALTYTTSSIDILYRTIVLLWCVYNSHCCIQELRRFPQRVLAEISQIMSVLVKLCVHVIQLTYDVVIGIIRLCYNHAREYLIHWWEHNVAQQIENQFARRMAAGQHQLIRNIQVNYQANLACYLHVEDQVAGMAAEQQLNLRDNDQADRAQYLHEERMHHCEPELPLEDYAKAAVCVTPLQARRTTCGELVVSGSHSYPPAQSTAFTQPVMGTFFHKPALASGQSSIEVLECSIREDTDVSMREPAHRVFLTRAEADTPYELVFV